MKVDVPEVTARYTCWPKMQSLFPAHFYAATIALCSPASALACESTFSVVTAYIMNKLRSRITAQTHELLALAKINVERSLKENDEHMAAGDGGQDAPLLERRRRWTRVSTASATRPSTIAAAAPLTID